eukprot:GFUD01022634.1.p1 GENE.GFUD01022634.1~~GFUD01022634.1.p1  ORF type:complete len:787 (+),score=168.87 GFUD01022634.1:426-2786(+)
MYWVLGYLFNMSVNTFNNLLYIASGVIWLMPIIKNLLLICSFIRLTSIAAVKLHNLCKYGSRLEQIKTKAKKRSNRVSFVDDNLSNDQENKCFIGDSQENTNDKFRNTKDYWNKNQSLLSLYTNGDHKLNNKLKKTKSLDQLTFIKHQLNTEKKRTDYQIANADQNDNERKVVKKNSSSTHQQNEYRKYKHETVFINGNEDESSDEIELLSSDEDSLNDSILSKDDCMQASTDFTDQESSKANYSISSDQLDAKCDHEFVRFAESTDLLEVLTIFSNIKNNLGLEVHSWTFKNVFPILKAELKSKVPYRYEELFSHLEKRSEAKEYHKNTVATGRKVLIIGAGPCGLRMAMEMQFLGAETTVIEARPYIDRNNVLKLWTFVMEDLKSLGAKKLYPQIGTGSVNHVSIRILQFVLLKMSLLLGTQVKIRETFKKIQKPKNEKRWTVISEVMHENGSIHEQEDEYDIVICASGRKVPIPGFERKSLEAKMSIAITANFVNNNSMEERKVKEIPGLSKQYDLEFFRNLENKYGIRLENIVYYKDLTHYFVMTAKKDSLIKKGVIKNCAEDRDSLLSPENVDRTALETYAVEAASFSTKHFSQELPKTPLAKWKGHKDVSIFDFTNLYTSQNACRVQERRGYRLLLGLVGDSLMEPFWPEGTGIGRGFLSVFDTAWLVKRFIEEPADKVYEVIREREKLYSLLRQTTDTSLKGHYKKWTINPVSRYPTTSFQFNQDRIYQLYDTDVEDDMDQDQVSMRKKGHKKSSKSWAGRMEEGLDTVSKRETVFIAD